MEYMLVKTLTYNGLVKEVNALIKKGWIPQGGIMEDSSKDCFQAMIKNEHD